MTFRAGVVLTACVAGAATCVAAAGVAVEPMAFTFSWKSVLGCTDGGRSPAFQVRHAPEETRFLVFSLTDPGGQLGQGQYVNYPPGGNVEAGAVSYMPPCKPGLYRWTVTATNRSGEVLASATAESRFPAD